MAYTNSLNLRCVAVFFLISASSFAIKLGINMFWLESRGDMIENYLQRKVSDKNIEIVFEGK